MPRLSPGPGPRRLLLALLVASAMLAGVGPAPASAQEAGPLAVLSIDPVCVGPWTGDDVGGSLALQVRGSGFEPGTRVRFDFGPQAQGPGIRGRFRIEDLPVDVVLEGTPTETQAPLAATDVDALGTFALAIDVWWPFEEGTYLVTAATEGGGPSAVAALQVPCAPAITVSPTCATATSEGEATTALAVEGAGFWSDITVDVRLEGDGLDGPLTLGSTAPDLDGRFVIEATVPALPDGLYRVVAEQPRRELLARAFLEAPCQRPTITLTDDCGLPGGPPARYAISVAGQGFRPGSRVTLTWDPGGSDEVWVTEAGENGDFTVRIRPHRRDDGRYVVTARDEVPRAPARQTRAVFVVPCPDAPEPTLLADPDCDAPALLGELPRNHRISVRGEHFAPGPVLVVFDADGPAPETWDAEVGEDGAFSLDIEPAARPSGTYSVTASQARIGRRNEGPALAASTRFRVPCRPLAPTLRPLVPDCGPALPGLEAAYRLMVRGRGFLPGPVEIAFGPDETAERFPAVADARGRIAAEILATGRDPGRYRVLVTQSDANGVVARARVAFLVPCPEPSPSPTPTVTPPPREARLVIRPDSGPAGYTALVRGTGFPSSARVELRWDRGLTADQPVSVEADASGRFSVAILILRHDLVGPRTLTAGAPGDADAYPTATATYVVTPGTGSPPNPGGSGYVIRR